MMFTFLNPFEPLSSYDNIVHWIEGNDNVNDYIVFSMLIGIEEK